MDGLCFLVKLEMLESFGNFEVVAGAFMEENDLIARANRCGYRAAIANQALCFTPAPPRRNLTALRRSWARTPCGKSIRIITPRSDATAGPRPTELFASSELSPRSRRYPLPSISRASGVTKTSTTEYGTKLVASFARRFKGKYRINVICEPFVWKHHELATMDGLVRSHVDADTLFPAIVRLGQPFDQLG